MSSKLPILLVLLLAPAPLPAQEVENGPTVEEILARHVEARGGLDAIAALGDLKISGTLVTPGAEMPLTMLRKRPHFLRVDIGMEGASIVQAFDGEMAWGVNPMAGAAEPAPLPEGESRVVAVQADFDGFLVEAAKKGHRVRLAGQEMLDEAEVYRLEVTLEGGGERTVYLDAETFLEVRQVLEVEAQGTPMEATVTLGDYRDVDGVQLAHRQVTSTAMGDFELTISSVEVVDDVDVDVFYMPGQEASTELTLEQILKRHREARDQPGRDAAETVKATGTVLFQGFQVPMTMYFERPKSFRVNIDLQGLEMVQAYDGEVAWTVSPMQGITEPEELPADAREAVAIFSDFLWGLLGRFQEEGASVELQGIEKVVRDETYHLGVTLGDVERDVYLGGEDFLERQLSFAASFMGRSGEIDARLSEYETFDGLVVPRRIELAIDGMPQGEMLIETVEVNADLEGQTFSMPPPPAPAGEPSQ